VWKLQQGESPEHGERRIYIAHNGEGLLTCLSLSKTSHTPFRIAYCFDHLNYSKRKANIDSYHPINKIHFLVTNGRMAYLLVFKCRVKAIHTVFIFPKKAWQVSVHSVPPGSVGSLNI
jgi:hypothetical protein